MKKKVICLLLATTLISTSVANITVYADSTNNSINIGDYVYNNPVNNKAITVRAYDDDSYLRNTGVYRGDNQGREIIPFTLKAGETIKAKQISGTGQVDLTLELIGGHLANEVNGTIKKDGTEVTLTAKEESVIYVKAPRSVFNDISVEYSISKATTLPIYTQDSTNEKVFFEEWELLNTKNAILQNDVIALQVPQLNFDYLKKLEVQGKFKNLDHLLEYYEDMIDEYDDFYGLDGRESYNYNPRQKYLVVPELTENSGVVAMYDKDIVRAYGSSLGLSNMLNGSWESKDVIAQGYKGDFVFNDYSVNGVWDDVLAHYYAMDENVLTNLYKINYNTLQKAKNQESVYDISNQIKSGNATTEYSVDFFRNIFDTFGTDLITEFNQEYRRLTIKGEADETNTNMFVKTFSEEADVDLAPYFISYGFDVDNNIIEENYQLTNAYYLADLVKSQDKIDYISAQYSLASKYALIDTGMFVEDKYLKTVTGDAEIQLSIDNLAELDGKQVELRNGEATYHADIINGKAKFNDIPVGAYNLFTPLTKSGDYYKQNEPYVIVSENGNTLAQGNYEKTKDNYLNLQYKFKILNDEDQVPLVADLSYVSDNNYKFKIQTFAGMYNEDAKNDNTYAYLKVYDNANSLVQSYEFENLTKSTDSLTNLTLHKGYTIHLYRKDERDKKIYENTVINKEYTDKNVDLMVFEINENGLTYMSGKDKSGDLLDEFIKQENSDTFRTSNQYYKSINRVYLKNAINQLDAKDQAYYTKSNAQALRLNNPTISLNKISISSRTGTDPAYQGIATASDAEDGSISKKITVDTSKVNRNKAGTYTATYRVEDSDHNYATADISVVVVGPDVNNGIDPNNVINNNTDDNNTTNNGSVTNGDVTITLKNREPYKVRVYDISNRYNELDNKNRVVPYIMDNNVEKRVKFSTYENGSLVYLDMYNTNNYEYKAYTKSFADVQTSWAKQNVEFVTARDILNGVSDNEFAPSSTVTRAMIVTVLGRLCDAKTSGYSNTFTDVQNNLWYTNYVSWAKANNIMGGVTETQFEPNSELSREQFAVTVYNFLNHMGYDITVNNVTNFNDDSKISSWSRDEIYALKALGIVNGDLYGNFNPNGNLTRAELSAILERVVKLTIDTERDLQK